MSKPEKIAEDLKDYPEISTVRTDYARGVRIPWQMKMWLKIILARLPLSYRFLTALGMFRHGDTSRNLANLHKGFERYYLIYEARYGAAPKNVLELGPGDSIGHALSAYIRGVEKSWLIDVGDFATRDPAHYQAYAQYLKDHALWPDARAWPQDFTREAILNHCGAAYHTTGLQALQSVPEASIDLSFSTAVWEHIRKSEFQDHMHALFRAHKAGSISCHNVDLHDHLGGALNSLRFSERFWEQKAVQEAGFYTNRLTMDEMITAAQNAGFQTALKRVIKWQSLPTPREKMAAPYRAQSEEILNVCTFTLELTKP